MSRIPRNVDLRCPCCAVQPVTKVHETETRDVLFCSSCEHAWVMNAARVWHQSATREKKVQPPGAEFMRDLESGAHTGSPRPEKDLMATPAWRWSFLALWLAACCISLLAINSTTAHPPSGGASDLVIATTLIWSPLVLTAAVVALLKRQVLRL